MLVAKGDGRVLTVAAVLVISVLAANIGAAYVATEAAVPFFLSSFLTLMAVYFAYMGVDRVWNEEWDRPGIYVLAVIVAIPIAVALMIWIEYLGLRIWEVVFP